MFLRQEMAALHPLFEDASQMHLYATIRAFNKGVNKGVNKGNAHLELTAAISARRNDCRREAICFVRPD